MTLRHVIESITAFWPPFHLLPHDEPLPQPCASMTGFCGPGGLETNWVGLAENDQTRLDAWHRPLVSCEVHQQERLTHGRAGKHD